MNFRTEKKILFTFTNVIVYFISQIHYLDPRQKNFLQVMVQMNPVDGGTTGTQLAQISKISYFTAKQ